MEKYNLLSGFENIVSILDLSVVNMDLLLVQRMLREIFGKFRVNNS